VLLPGDPHRALHVAQELLEKPLMFNHSRGLWGYTGTARDGELLTIQSTGMGGPSAAIVVRELIDLGARTLIRIGTCGALVEGLELGNIVAAEAVLPADGASQALDAQDLVQADPALTEASGRPKVTAVSTDLFYDAREELPGQWVRAGASVVEMEAATVLRTAQLHEGVRAACLLAVSDVLPGGRVRADADQVHDMGLALGEAGMAALLAV
jgi:uridine phosphorylase